MEEDKKVGTSLEEICLNRITDLLEKIPNKGKNIDLRLISRECKKIEADSSID